MRRRIVLVSSFTALFFSSMGTAVLAAVYSNVEGYVKDAVTGDPLPSANVVIVGTRLGAATDMNGRYTIRNVPAGSYMLRASYIGYKSVEVPIELKEGANVTMDLKLEPVGVQGKVVVVTAQALGQTQAINQQLAALPIVNVVSSARIQELPDANAAESVGRLPGVSLVREGGEGAQVVIRGLAPKYNAVMINGVQMAATDVGNRGVNLSMISSNMLGGIEVTKAITPDMDAEVLGGSVNFTLREAKETKGVPGINLLAQGGYNNLQGTYSDYKLVGSIENRFFEGGFGIFAEIDVEKRNLTSNELGASYYLNGPQLGIPNPTYLNGLNLIDIPRDRQRYGGTVVMDYRLAEGKIELTNFFSAGDTRTQSRSESYSLTSNEHDYTTSDSRNKLNVMTNLLEIEKSLSFVSVDAKLSHSYSENRDPNDMTVEFIQQLAALNNPSYQRMNPQLIPKLAHDSLEATFLQNLANSKTFSRDRTVTGSLDFQSNLLFSDEITSTIKFGGKYQYRWRSYDYDQGDGVLTYSGGNVRQAILDAFPWMKQTIPNGNFKLPITLFEDPSFKYGKFLGGDYTMGVPVNIDLMWQVLGVAQKYGTLEAYVHNDLASITNDYSGNENETAAYAMATVRFGPDITILPGVRYQLLRTSYTAPRGIETSTSRYMYNYRDTTIDESHAFWLPMVQLKYEPLSWFQVHLAYTNTLTYPDYNTITPRIDVGINSVAWNNFALKPAHSSNYDVVLSLYSNSIGLFTVDGFWKHIDNLIFPTSRYVINESLYPGVPSSTVGHPVRTYINNPYAVDLRGIELDWQTHFWYLPGPLSGLVLGANYTHIFSAAKYPRTTVNTTYSSQPPYVVIAYVDTSYTNRLIDQPNDIVNLAIGYDYKGFSMRVSMLYQDNVFEGENFWPELRTNTAKYLRWDLSLKQELPWFGFQLYLDLNNINAARDVTLNQGSSFPASEQHYDMSADIGLRWKL